MAASAESIRKRLEEKKREIEAKLAAAASSSSSITTVGLHPPATGPRVSLSSSFGIKDVSTQSLLGKRSSSASNQPGNTGLLFVLPWAVLLACTF